MSTWGIGDNHDSEEVRTLKEQLRTKGGSYMFYWIVNLTYICQGAQHATLHGEFCKREAELKEVKTSLDEALLKVRDLHFPTSTPCDGTSPPLSSVKTRIAIRNLKPSFRSATKNCQTSNTLELMQKSP